MKGLEGDADHDRDGYINIDELYNYAYEKVKAATPKQTPSKFSSKQQGEIVLREFKRKDQIPSVALPDELIEATEDSRTFVREGAVQQLELIVKGKNIGLARSALEALEKIASDENTTRRVEQLARQVLDAYYQEQQRIEEERRQREEEERQARQKAEEERLAQEKAAEERKAEEARRRAEQRAKRLVEKEKRDQHLREEAERIAREKIEAELEAEKEAKRRAREEEERKRNAKEEAERIAREKIQAEIKAKKEAERLAQDKEAQRILQAMQSLQYAFTRYVILWGSRKTEEAQARQGVRLENETLDLYFDGKGYLFTPQADMEIIQRAAKLARYTNIYIIAYKANDDLIPMATQVKGVELYRLYDMTKTGGVWSWIDFDIFISQNPRVLPNRL